MFQLKIWRWIKLHIKNDSLSSKLWLLQSFCLWTCKKIKTLKYSANGLNFYLQIFSLLCQLINNCVCLNQDPTSVKEFFFFKFHSVVDEERICCVFVTNKSLEFVVVLVISMASTFFFALHKSKSLFSFTNSSKALRNLVFVK